MGNRFSTTGTVSKAFSGRSLKIEIGDQRHYVSIKGVEAVIAGRKKWASVFRPNANPYRPRY